MPSDVVGLNFDFRAASSAAARNIGLPLTARAAITFPISSIVTWTCTRSERLRAIAAGGYCGFGSSIAKPFTIPSRLISAGRLSRRGAKRGDGGGLSVSVLPGVYPAASRGPEAEVPRILLPDPEPIESLKNGATMKFWFGREVYRLTSADQSSGTYFDSSIRA